MLDAAAVRTTLDIDTDVLLAAKQLAQQRQATMGQIVSDLIRQALPPRRPVTQRNRVPLFPARKGSPVVTLELVNRLRDEKP
jgi:hypothetical protein